MLDKLMPSKPAEMQVAEFVNHALRRTTIYLSAWGTLGTITLFFYAQSFS
jgi:hypothetical protein